MANFFADNEDIQFLFNHLDLKRAAGITEEGFRFAKEFDFAPVDADDAVDNYRRVLTTVGEIAGEVVAPAAEETDLTGNKLNEDGSVTRPPGIELALKRLAQADLMGFTLPYRHGGINCPTCVYTISNDIISRGDASLMNLYGLQGIAETINAFASEEIKKQYLPPMASGQWTGAMVLTEPDAGSDLQSVKTRAYQDEQGNWKVRGVKRFITNGCGEVLLVLSRTEPEVTDGRGLSLLLVERGPRVKVRRLENKLGIHGSPTCEIFFDDAPALLIGERQRGLITYVMSLMNGARIGIAAQSLGIGEAAYRVARDYAHSRKQFETAIENFPAVRELLANMNTDLAAARALTYFSSFYVDLELGPMRKLEFGGNLDKDELTRLRKETRHYSRYNKLLTPLSKYYASEMCMRVANDSIAVLGGSGYMKDYPLERHLRDSRITTIYEGTSQLQVVAAVAGVLSGTAQNLLEEMISKPTRASGPTASQATWPADVLPLIAQIKEGMVLMQQAIDYVKSSPGNGYKDLHARKLVDIAVFLIIGAIFCDFAASSDKKLPVARYWLSWRMPEIRMLKEKACSGELGPVTDFDVLAGPVPVVE